MNRQLKKFVSKPVQIAALILLVGVSAILLRQFSPAQRNQETNNSTEDKEQALETKNENLKENYSYIIKAGDGVTHMIIDFAQANDEDLTPLEAFDIAKANGQQFLDNGLTVPMDAPFTEGIGGFPEPGKVISAKDYPALFNQISAGFSEAGNTNGDSSKKEDAPDSEDEDEEQAGEQQEGSPNRQDDATDNEEGTETSASQTDNFEYRWLILIGSVLAFLWFLLRRRSEDDLAE